MSKRFLAICAISLLPSTGSAAQQTWLGCTAADTMAAVTALGVTYRVSKNLVDLALEPNKGDLSDILLKRSVHRGWTSSDTDNTPTRAKLILSDIELRGFWPALAMGTFAAAAARSGSLTQLEMKDVLKPAACAFGALFAIGAGSALLRSERSVVKSVVGNHNNYNVFAWEQDLVDYGTYVGMACVPLYLFYQRYMNSQQHGLGCEATNIMAGVVAAGVAYRSLYSLICFVSAPDNVNYSMQARRCARAPEDFGLDVLYKGFYPALVAGTLTAVAARSGSWKQLSMNDVIKPAAWGFGSLFAASMPFVLYSGKYQREDARLLQAESTSEKKFEHLNHLKTIANKIHDESKWAEAKNNAEQAKDDYRKHHNDYKARRDSAINWERCVIGYAQNALIVGLPLYVLYQRYKNQS